jgi:hypothetical protein
MNVVSRRQYYDLSAIQPSISPSDTSTTHLAFLEHSAIAVEQLERREDVTLYQDSRHDGRCCPPSCAHGHLEEPLFQGQLAHRSVAATAQHCSHVERCSVVRQAEECVDSFEYLRESRARF